MVVRAAAMADDRQSPVARPLGRRGACEALLTDLWVWCPPAGVGLGVRGEPLARPGIEGRSGSARADVVRSVRARDLASAPGHSPARIPADPPAGGARQRHTPQPIPVSAYLGPPIRCPGVRGRRTRGRCEVIHAYPRATNTPPGARRWPRHQRTDADSARGSRSHAPAGRLSPTSPRRGRLEPGGRRRAPRWTRHSVSTDNPSVAVGYGTLAIALREPLLFSLPGRRSARRAERRSAVATATTESRASRRIPRRAAAVSDESGAITYVVFEYPGGGDRSISLRYAGLDPR
jgi:hypothetical protein